MQIPNIKDVQPHREVVFDQCFFLKLHMMIADNKEHDVDRCASPMLLESCRYYMITQQGWKVESVPSLG